MTPKILLTAVIPFMLTAVPARAQEITGMPGSLTATTTIDGRTHPAPPGKFGGVIKENAFQSKPYWPPTDVPPKGAPNVLLIMTDDVGFGALLWTTGITKFRSVSPANSTG
jgi:hypothetical protein